MPSMPSFFSLQDDFFSIVQTILPDVRKESIQHIKTGWTNIVIEASTNDTDCFFRFPRNDFFARMMLKDHAFCTFIQGKTSFQTPYLHLFFDQGRPFSMHQKIKGWSLSQRFSHLSRQMMSHIAMDISKFIFEISALPVSMLPAQCAMPVSQFLDELSTVNHDAYDLSKHDPFRLLEEKPSIVHGDLHPGNILLDEHNTMVGVLDFCFAGTSHRYVDLSRIIGRSPKEFAPLMFDQYEDVMKTPVDRSKINELIGVWHYVEQQYISYMKCHHPYIILPDSV